MSQFVNYHKRAFTLPPGCKDLIDVLKPSRRQAKVQGASVPEIHEDHFHTAGLAQIGHYVSLLLDSPTDFTLTIIHPDDRPPVVLCRNPLDPLGAAVVAVAANDSDAEQHVRVFFRQQDVQLLQEFEHSLTGAAGKMLIYPLPLDPPQATNLTTALLRDVYGLSDVAGLDFHYYQAPSSSAAKTCL